LRAVYVGLDGLDGAFDDELDATAAARWTMYIGSSTSSAATGDFRCCRGDIACARGLQMTNVFDTASGKVVEQDDAVAAMEKTLGEM